MSEIVWVTQGKTEHLATLVGTLGLEGQDYVEIRWSSTREKAFVPVNTVRRDDGSRRRRTVPVTYNETHISQPPPPPPPPTKNETTTTTTLLESKAATKGKRRNREEDKTSQHHKGIDEDDTNIGPEPPKKRLKGPTTVSKAGKKERDEQIVFKNAQPHQPKNVVDNAGRMKKSNHHAAISNQGLSKKNFVASHTIAGTAFGRNNSVEKDPDTQGLSKTQADVKDGNSKGTFVKNIDGHGGREEDSQEATSLSFTFVMPRKPKSASNPTQPRQQETTSSISKFALKTRPLEVDGIRSVNMALPIEPDATRTKGVHQDTTQPAEVGVPSEEKNVVNKSSQSTRAMLNDGTSRQLHNIFDVADAQDNVNTEATNTQHVPVKTNANKPDDTSHVAHTDRPASGGGGTASVKESKVGLQYTAQMNPPSKRALDRISVQMDMIPNMLVRNSEGNDEQLDGRIPVQAHVCLIPTHAAEPQSRDGVLSIAQGLKIPPVAVNLEKKGGAIDENNFFSSDDEALNVAVHRLKFGDGTSGLVPASRKKNIHGPCANPKALIRPKNVKGLNNEISSSDEDVIVRRSILSTQLSLQSKNPSSQSPKGFEKELSKQQRLFMAEIAGHPPAGSSNPTKRKERRIRINKQNWNNIEKLKISRGSDDDSTPALKGD